MWRYVKEYLAQRGTADEDCYSLSDNTRWAARNARSTMKRFMLMPLLAAACSMLNFSSSLSNISIPLFLPVLGLRLREPPGSLLGCFFFIMNLVTSSLGRIIVRLACENRWYENANETQKISMVRVVRRLGLVNQDARLRLSFDFSRTGPIREGFGSCRLVLKPLNRSVRN